MLEGFFIQVNFEKSFFFSGDRSLDHRGLHCLRTSLFKLATSVAKLCGKLTRLIYAWWFIPHYLNLILSD